MSTDSNSDLVTAYRSFLLSNYAVYATAALATYEHLITFKYEIDFFKRRKFSGATWIFVLNRYLLLVNVISSVVPISAQLCDSPANIVFVYFTDGPLTPLPNRAFTTLRCFAIMHNHAGRLAVTGLMVALTLVCFILETLVTSTVTFQSVNDPLLGASCYSTGYSVAAATIDNMNMALSVAAIVMESLVLAVTLVTTVRQVRQAYSLGIRATLSKVLWRDGSMFFLIILIYNIIFAIPSLSDAIFTEPVGNLIILLFNTLQTIVLTRFIINLRQAGTPESVPSADEHTTLRFSNSSFRLPTVDEVVDNLGEPLDFVEYCVDIQDDQQDDDTGASIIGEPQHIEEAIPTTTDIETTSPSGDSIARAS